MHARVTLALFSLALLGRNLAGFSAPEEWTDFMRGFATPLGFNRRADQIIHLPDILTRASGFADSSHPLDMKKVRIAGPSVMTPAHSHQPPPCQRFDVKALKVLLCSIAGSRPTASMVISIIQTSDTFEYGDNDLRKHTMSLLTRYLYRPGHPPGLPEGMVPDLQLQMDKEAPEDVRPSLFVLSALGQANFTLGSDDSKITARTDSLSRLVCRPCSPPRQLRFVPASSVRTDKGAQARGSIPLFSWGGLTSVHSTWSGIFTPVHAASTSPLETTCKTWSTNLCRCRSRTSIRHLIWLFINSWPEN